VNFVIVVALLAACLVVLSRLKVVVLTDLWSATANIVLDIAVVLVSLVATVAEAVVEDGVAGVVLGEDVTGGIMCAVLIDRALGVVDVNVDRGLVLGPGEIRVDDVELVVVNGLVVIDVVACCAWAICTSSWADAEVNLVVLVVTDIVLADLVLVRGMPVLLENMTVLVDDVIVGVEVVLVVVVLVDVKVVAVVVVDVEVVLVVVVLVDVNVVVVVVVDMVVVLVVVVLVDVAVVVVVIVEVEAKMIDR
jgi:hypothetical protein